MSKSMDVKDAAKALSDFFNFKTFITTGFARTIWGLQVLLALLWIFSGESFLSPGSRILISLFWLVISRLFMEAFVILFRIADLLREIRDQGRFSESRQVPS